MASQVQPGSSDIICLQAWKSLLASLLAPGTRIWMTTAPNFKFSLSPVEANTIYFPLPGCPQLFCISLLSKSYLIPFHWWCQEHRAPTPRSSSPAVSHWADSQQEPQLEGRTGRQRVSARCLKQQMSHNTLSLTEKIKTWELFKKFFAVKTTLILLPSCQDHIIYSQQITEITTV